MREIKLAFPIRILILAITISGCIQNQRTTQTPLPTQGRLDRTPTERMPSTITESLVPTPTSIIRALNPIPWEETAPHIHLIENQIVYEEDFSNLPPGDYAFFNDQGQRLTYLSLGEERIRGTLATYSDWVNLHAVFSDGDLWVIDNVEEDNVFHFENISQKETLLVGPLCSSSVFYSPNLRRIISICRFPDNTDQESTFYEIIDLKSGIFYKVWLPTGNYPKFFWLDDSRFILSRVYLEGKSTWFIVDLENWTIQHRPSEYQNLEVVRLSEDNQYVLLDIIRGHGLIIAHLDCITGKGECPMWIIVNELSDWRSWSPDNSLMSNFEIPFDVPWTITILGGSEWSEIQNVIEIPRGYPFQGFWCPDSTCLFIEKGDGSAASFIVDLEGNIEELPYTNLIGAFRLP